MVKERDFGLVLGGSATVNGYSEINITSDENMIVEQDGETCNIKLKTENFQEPITGIPGKIASFDENGNIISVDPFDVIPTKPIQRDYELYEFTIDQSESDPDSMITYSGDNTNYARAHMDFDTGVFDYGDWEDAFFIRNLRPCVLNYDGTVAYDIDKNNYTKKTDGNPGPSSSSTFVGNVMVGIPTVWIKIENTGADITKVSICNKRLDPNFHAYAHEDVNGNIMPYTYIAAYEASYDTDNSLYRSRPSIYPSYNTTYDTEVSYANAVNTRGSVTDIWDIGTWGDRILIQLLLLLIGKSCDTQQTFGYGNCDGYTTKPSGSDNYGHIRTGTMNTVGLFWGSSSHDVGVKVFGIENFWGNNWERIQGLINDNGTYKVKLCRSTSDGSSGTTYNATGSGYKSAGSAPSASGSYIRHLSYPLLLPDGVTGGSSSTKYSDAMWSANDIVGVAIVGGASIFGLPVGAFALNLDGHDSNSSVLSGARLSAKPKVS